MLELTSLLKDFGPLIGIVLFFIWRDWKREEGLVERVRKLEDFNTEVLTNIVRESTAVIATNTAQLKVMVEMMSDCGTRQDG
jgi:hypothetical protein